MGHVLGWGMLYALLTCTLNFNLLTFSSQLCCGSSSFAFIYVFLLLSALALMWAIGRYVLCFKLWSLTFSFLFGFMLYLSFSYFILFASSLWTLYFGLELQWMFLSAFIIIGSSLWRGLLNYLILNGILSALLILAVLFINLWLFIFGVFSKVGYFPWFLILSYQYYSSSYLWIFFDVINKWAYLGSIIFVLAFSCVILYAFCDWYVLMNFLMIIFLVRLFLSMKHFILISSLQLFLFIIAGLFFSDDLLCFVYLLFYSASTLYLIWDCQGYTGGAYLIFRLLSFTFSLNFSILSFNSHLLTLNCGLQSVNFKLYFFTDLASIRELVIINSLLYILYWFIMLSFFPSVMFLIKFFLLLGFLSYSCNYCLLLIAFLIFILQSFYLRSLGIILGF